VLIPPWGGREHTNPIKYSPLLVLRKARGNSIKGFTLVKNYDIIFVVIRIIINQGLSMVNIFTKVKIQANTYSNTSQSIFCSINQMLREVLSFSLYIFLTSNLACLFLFPKMAREKNEKA
jgi:hypothetical protein